MAKEYINLAKSIIQKHSLNKYIDLLLGHWEQNPTSLGHGFAHVLKCAVEAYELGELNNYSDPNYLFVGGLLHDIVRPAEDKAGEEDLTAGAQVVEQIFNENSLDQKLKLLITGAILSHDSWIGEEKVPQFDLILSTGNKAAHDMSVIYGYVWASNKFCVENDIEPVFKSHFQTLYLFNKYQQRAWNLFAKNPINGTERAIKAYLEIYQVTANNYLDDSNGERFNHYVDAVAESVRKEEKMYLANFGIENVRQERLLKRFY